MSQKRASRNTRRTKTQPMTPSAVRRIQSKTAIRHGGQTPKGGFVARAQRTVAKEG